MIDLYMLGEIRLVASNGENIDGLLRQPKRLALLAYLAMPTPGTWHRRDTLLPLFWPELDTAHARTSLRNALHVLRRHLGDGVVRTRGDEEVSVDAAALRTDVGALWDAHREGRTEDALACVAGELLPGLYPSDSDGFLRFLEGERARLVAAVTGAATTHLDALARAGRLEESMAIARRIAALQPDDETLVRRIMQLHETMGNRAGALAAYEGYRTRLAAEFDAAPAQETTDMVQRLRAAGYASHSASALESSSVPTSLSPRTARRALISETEPGALAEAPPAFEADAPPMPPRRATAMHRRTSLATVVIVGALGISVVFAMRGWRAPPPLPTIGRATPVTAEEGLQVEAAISPNGRLVAYARGSVNRLQIVVQSLNGGAPWRLTTDTAATELMPRWSPDNDLVLYLARDNAYVAPSIGGAPRLVARGAPGDGKVRSASWSPQGDSVLFVRNDSLLVRPLVGEGSRLIGTGRQLHGCVWSPRIAWIACVAGNWVAFEPGPVFGNRASSALVLFPASGGSALDLTGSEYQHDSPAWSPDGVTLWFASNRGGTPNDVFAVRIARDGRAAAAFERVGLVAESVSLTTHRVAFSVPVRRANIWAVSIPRTGIATLASATRVTSGTQLIETVNVSPDGEWLLFDSDVRGNADIYRLPVGGGDAERLTDDRAPEFVAAMSPDGRSLAWQRSVNGERRVFERWLDSDSARQVFDLPGDFGGPRWSPDGRAIAAWSHVKESGVITVARRAANGAWQRPAWMLAESQLPVWSADGRRLAFIRFGGAIGTISADSGPVTVVYAPRPNTSDPQASNVVWSLHPDTIWFIGSNATGHGGIWSVPAAGGTPRLRVDLQDDTGPLHGPTIATDGRRFYFTLDERFSNVRWAELVTR